MRGDSNASRWRDWRQRVGLFIWESDGGPESEQFIGVPKGWNRCLRDIVLKVKPQSNAAGGVRPRRRRR